MTLGSLSIAYNNATAANQFSTAILGKELNNSEEMGKELAKQIQQAPGPSLESMVNPAIGGNIDLYI
ncbi:MAG: YjfB family protein [Lachnospiraceae bacterium]|nr:YjfB family protein [Lachnospiraceae bacterium]